MEIDITGSESIKEVKEQFQNLFPMLKVEFFYHSHGEGQGSALSDKISDEHKLEEIRTLNKEGKIIFSSNTKISDLESEFHDKYGLNVQVFRKSGSIWLEIITTDQRTLAEENEWAVEMSKPVDD